MIPSIHHASRAGRGINCRHVFFRCPQIREALTPELAGLLSEQVESVGVSRIVGALSPQSAAAASTSLPRNDKHHALAEYALASTDNRLHSAKYLLELTEKDKMQRFGDEQLQEERE